MVMGRDAKTQSNCSETGSIAERVPFSTQSLVVIGKGSVPVKRYFTS